MHIYCDKSQVKQALINFLLNSIDAVTEKKCAQIPVTRPGLEWRVLPEAEMVLLIRDNGIGMDEVVQNLDMFYTTKEKEPALAFRCRYRCWV